MPYASKDDLIAAAGDYERFRQLVENRAAPPDEPDAAEYWVRQAQRSADAFIDAILQPAFATPLQNPSDAIVMLAAHEGIYFLANTRGMARDEDHEAHADRRAALEAMRDGKRAPANHLPQPTPNGRPAMVKRRDAWSRHGLKGFA